MHSLLTCFNFCLRSDIPLHELIAAEEPGARDVVEIRLGHVPETLPDAHSTTSALQCADGIVLVTIPGVARYLVRGGREIVVDPLPDGSERNVRLFLLGSVLGILCHQRGLLPLHANAVVANGGAYAFSGHSGAGKSTLAAHFARSDHEVLCDDVCVISFDEAGAPLAWPGLPRLKLWGDAIAALGQARDGLDRAVDGLDKYHLPIAASAVARPVPLRRLYLLLRAEAGAAGEIVRLRGQQAMAALMANTYRGLCLKPMGLTRRHFLQCAALASRIEVYAASRKWGYEVFAEEAERLTRHVLEVA